MRGDNLYYDDDYSGVVQCFTMTGSGDMTRRGTIEPTDEERYMYTTTLTQDVRDSFNQRGMFYWMALGITLLSDGRVGCVYDLPWVFEMSNGDYAFFNFPAMLVRDEADLLPREPVLPDEHFFDDMDEVESYFSNFNIIDSTRMLFGMKKLSWPIDGFEEFTGNPDHDAFMDEFYERGTPCLELVDVKTGKSIKRFGNLPEAQAKTKTGYYFFNPTVDSHGGEVVYSDSYSGEVQLADNATPWDVKRTYRAFAPDPERKPAMDTTKFYTLEYASDYYPYFCRSIQCMKLTDDKIHVLVKVSYSLAHTTKERIFEYSVIDRRSGEVETSFRVGKEFDDEYMIAAGLSDDEEPVLFYLSERGGRYYMTEVSEI